jgi:hypothetical protein
MLQGHMRRFALGGIDAVPNQFAINANYRPDEFAAVIVIIKASP